MKNNSSGYMCGAISRVITFNQKVNRVTFYLQSEHGVSLTAAGWKEIWKTRGGYWNRESRPRVDKHPTMPKTMWMYELEIRNQE